MGGGHENGFAVTRVTMTRFNNKTLLEVVMDGMGGGGEGYGFEK